MSRTVHGTACWECLDFNIKNTMGEECEGNKHIFCDKSLAEHDKQIKKQVIKEIEDAMYHQCFECDNDEDMQKWDGGNWIRYKLFERVMEQLKENNK